MKLFSLLLAVVAGAAIAGGCGGSSRASATPSGADPAAARPSDSTAVPPLWAEVMTEGKVFTLENIVAEDEYARASSVVAEVRKVTRHGDAVRAHLAWTDNHGTQVVGPPTLIQWSPAGVWFGDDEAGDPVGPPTFPTEGDAAEGYEVSEGYGGKLCFGEAPGEDAPPCDDVCFAQICVDAGLGIVSGGGTWFPNYELYEQAAE